MANQTYFKYIYDGTNNFISPSFDDNISNIKCFVNSQEVTFTFLTPTSVQLDNEPNIDDIVEIFRFTYDDNRLVDFTNNSILKEQDLDKNSDQLFYLIEELKNNDTKDLEFLQGQLNEFVSEKNNIDSSSYVDGNLNNQIQVVQEALDIIDALTIASSSDDITIDTVVDGNGNLTGNSTTLSDLISEIDILDLDDVATNDGNNTLEGQNSSLKLQDIVDILNQYQTKNSEVTDADVQTTATDGNGNFDSGLTTVKEKLDAADGTTSGFDPAKQYKTATPTLSGPTTGNEGELLVVTITNYDSQNAYNAQVTGGSIVFNNNTIQWTLPSVTSNESHSLTIYATKTGELQSDNGQKDISVIDVPIGPDDSIIYNSFTDGINVENNTNFNTSNTLLETIGDNASIENIVDSQEGGQGDWVSNQETVSIELKEVITETGTTNNLLRTKEVVSTGDKFLIDTNVADDPQIGFKIVGTPTEVLEGVGDLSVVNEGTIPALWATDESNLNELRLDDGDVCFFEIENNTLSMKRYDSNGDFITGSLVTLLTNFKSALFGANVGHRTPNGNIFIGYTKVSDNYEYGVTFDKLGNIVTNEFSLDIISDNGKKNCCVLPNGNILVVRYGRTNVIPNPVNYDIDVYSSTGTLLTTGNYVNNSLDGISYIHPLSEDSFVMVFNPGNNSTNIITLDTDGAVISNETILNQYQFNTILDVLENDTELLFLDKNQSTKAYYTWIHSKSSLTAITDVIGHAVDLGNDTYAIIKNGTSYTKYTKDVGTNVINYSSGSLPYTRNRYNFLKDDGNIRKITGDFVFNPLDDYNIKISEGTTTYEVDISSLGLTANPDAFYFDPDITFSTSMVATGNPSNFVSKTLDDFNIDVLGNVTLTYPTTNVQGRDYKWKIEVPKNNRLENIFNVTSNFTRLGA